MAALLSTRVSRRRLLAGVAASSALVAAPPFVRAQAPALKIAVLLPRSGYLAQAGQSCHRGALVAPLISPARLNGEEAARRRTANSRQTSFV